MEIYAILQFIWWLILGVLLTGIGIMVGMDMGVGTILRYVGRSDIERRVALNVIGPHWDGNQVWFVLGGGAAFAAFPLLYATAFSGFYVVMLVLLWAMIVRPLGFEYRGHLPQAGWRNVWDWCLFISGAVPMLVFGAAIGNLFVGAPFHFSWNLTSTYTGSFLHLFNPFALLCGVLALALAVLMGGLRLAGGATGAVRARALRAAWIAGIVAIVLFAIGGFWVHAMDGYRLVHSPGAGVAQTPFGQAVAAGTAGAWLDNFTAHPALWLLPAAGFVGVVGALAAASARHPHVGWWLGALAWAGVIGTVGVALFPFLLPSSSTPDVSLTIWNASSSRLTLAWMLGFTGVFIPLIVWYTSWAFWVMRGKVTPEQIENNEHAY